VQLKRSLGVSTVGAAAYGLFAANRGIAGTALTEKNI
jgi:hypothetical protein